MWIYHLCKIILYFSNFQNVKKALLQRFSSLRVPFSWKTPYGYFFTLIFAAIDCYSTTSACSATVIIIIGSTWVLITIAEDVTNSLIHLSTIIDSSHTRESQIYEQFYNIVELFSNLKELSITMPM